jgi:hypothetical protein
MTSRSMGPPQSWHIHLSRSKIDHGVTGVTVAPTSLARCLRLTSLLTHRCEHHRALIALQGFGVNVVPHSGQSRGSGID